MLIRLTGPISVEHCSSQPRYLTSPQSQVAFARLVAERSRGTSRDQLAETIWPAGLPETWPSALRSVISRVRNFIDGPVLGMETASLTARGGCYVLRLPPGTFIDVEDAERSVEDASKLMANCDYARSRASAEECLASLGGPFLTAHDGEWVTSARERVDALRLSALEVASLASSFLGDEYRALRYAEEAVHESPFRESAHRCRIVAHAAVGNRAEALRAYHGLREALDDEFGIDPTPGMQTLYLQLLRTPDAGSWGPLELLRCVPG